MTLGLGSNGFAADLDTVGVTLLRQVSPGLLGNGVWVAQPEAASGSAFEVNPSTVGQTTNLFTWISGSGSAGTFPNSVGSESGHANDVAGNFYGTAHGVAPQLFHVNNYDADYFVNQIVSSETAIPARIVNQSFTFSNGDGSHMSSNDEASINLLYDDYAAQFGTLFVSGAGNNNTNTVFPPASSYNGIGVGVFPGNSSIGPTPDGRSKPELIAPGGGATSFSTPFVSGTAAVLLQAALRGDGGSNTNAASDTRTLKALLLNGAIKPADWTNSVVRPLDGRYGAGMLNAFNSWHDLTGGKRAFIESTSVSRGNPHPPGANVNNEPVLTGWDFNTLTDPDPLHEAINHYYFNLTGSNAFTLTATLVWQRPHSTLLNSSPGVNDLNLFLYNTANNNLVLCSTSAVDNVEHLFKISLPPGRYDLQVEKNPTGELSTAETYALAFEFFNVNLGITQTNGNIVLIWPIAPAGFQLQSTTNLTSAWSPVPATVTVDTNANQNIVTVPSTAGTQFFRLQRP